jgi:hypothetical protein
VIAWARPRDFGNAAGNIEQARFAGNPAGRQAPQTGTGGVGDWHDADNARRVPTLLHCLQPDSIRPAPEAGSTGHGGSIAAGSIAANHVSPPGHRLQFPSQSLPRRMPDQESTVQALQDILVRNRFDEPVRLGKLWTGRSAILVFVRHFG